MKQRISLLPSNGRIDTHCHLFNKKVLSWRLVIDFVQSRINEVVSANADTMENVGSLKTIKRAIHFLKIGMQPSSEEVYKTLITTEKGYSVVPLMFDLDYCMKGAHGVEGKMESSSIESELIAAYNQILTDDREKLLRIKGDTDYRCNICNNTEESQNEIDELVQTIDSLLNPDYQANELDFAHRIDPFLDQENQLVDLQKKHPDTVFPFYVVDPRRKENFHLENGSYDLTPILKRLAINGGHFYGIKLYTPNGYSPADPMLMPLYEYCEKHAIPLTAHCSGGGFASFVKTVNIHGLIYRNNAIEKYNGNITFNHYKITDSERVHEKAQMLNHPLLWEKVLEQYPHLTLNLAHFGSSASSEEWSEHIIRLMKLYPNLYTDFSCIADESTLNNMYHTYYSKATPLVKNRFLYGSDFYLNMLFIDNMKQYINHFEKVFSPAEMREISEMNPRRFLGFE